MATRKYCLLYLSLSLCLVRMAASDLLFSLGTFLLPLNTCPCHSAWRQIPIYQIPSHTSICVILSSLESCQIWTQRTSTSLRVSIWGVHQGNTQFDLDHFWTVKHRLRHLDVQAHLVGHYPKRQVAWTRFLHVPASWKRDGFTATWHVFEGQIYFGVKPLVTWRVTGLAKMKVISSLKKT